MANKPKPLAGILAPRGHKAPGNLVFAGLPDDSQSSCRSGAAKAPARVRRAYDGRCYNSCTESGLDLAGMVTDLGDWPAMGSWEETAASYREQAAGLFRKGMVPFFCGGDHAVTVPVVRALAELGRPVQVIQIDAHPDLYRELDGNPSSHACTGRLILEMEHVAGLTVLGVRAVTPAQQKLASQYGSRLHLIPAKGICGSLPDLKHLPPGSLVYLSIDLDAFDPAFAPGVNHPVPGGFNSRQVIDFIQDLPWQLVGMDVVELNPDRDLKDLTAVLAGGLFHEAIGGRLGRRQDGFGGL